MAKQLLFDDRARLKLARGVRTLADAVRRDNGARPAGMSLLTRALETRWSPKMA